MSLNTDELNYLIWRYLQESGLEVSALAVLDETTVAQFDDRYKGLVPIGSLVNLVQKGILYSEADSLVSNKGDVLEKEAYQEKFTIFHALGTEVALNGEPTMNRGRFEADRGPEASSTLSDVPDTSKDNSTKADVVMTNGDGSREGSPEGFVKILETVSTLGPTTTSQWSPSTPTSYAFGLSGSRAKLFHIPDGTTEPQQVSLNHPQVFGSENATPDVTALAWSPNGHLLVTGVESGEMRIWSMDGRLQNVLFMHQAPIIMVRWNSSGTHILSTDAENVTIVWDAATGGVLQHYETLRHADQQPLSATSTSTGLGTPVVGSEHVLGIDSAWIDDNKFILPGLNGSALVCTTSDRQPIGTLFGHTKPLSIIDFNQEFSLLLTASDDRSLRIWNGASFNNMQAFLGHSQPITYAGWITRDIVVSCALDSSVRLWSVLSGQQVDMAVADGIPIVSGRLSPDKTRIAVGTMEGVVMIFAIELRSEKGLKKVGEYQPSVSIQEVPNNVITSLSWSSDSRKIIVGYSQTDSVVLNSI